MHMDDEDPTKYTFKPTENSEYLEMVLYCTQGDLTQEYLPIRGGPAWVDWGDGSDIEYLRIVDGHRLPFGDFAHKYDADSQYTIRVYGSFRAFEHKNYYYQPTRALLRVTSWPSRHPLRLCFDGHKELTSVGDPPLCECTQITFERCTNFNQDINHWDVYGLVTMARMFLGCENFNQPLDKWNTVNVKDMSRMFWLASSFNQPLDKWNTTKVEDMSQMFMQASSFNQPLAKWNTANVKDMSRMFWLASSFNQPLGSWETDNVTDMSHMFQQASLFHQPLSRWDTTNVKDMSHMFE
jgi:surface protein